MEMTDNPSKLSTEIQSSLISLLVFVVVSIQKREIDSFDKAHIIMVSGAW